MSNNHAQKKRKDKKIASGRFIPQGRKAHTRQAQHQGDRGRGSGRRTKKKR